VSHALAQPVQVAGVGLDACGLRRLQHALLLLADARLARHSGIASWQRSQRGVPAGQELARVSCVEVGGRVVAGGVVVAREYQPQRVVDWQGGDPHLVVARRAGDVLQTRELALETIPLLLREQARAVLQP